ncbi:hypothetical protein EYS42_15575 [Aquabacterium lacunae]|uniref:Uncharacterized protein n=1 Tax=Aquabacterium lacunae TaxID=2528630 RepID=A0A4Q9GWZ9_9BURK|nr:hypothetical protein [Aquabacterium lacunae]TBO27855.1 hypothetical protein EYS42_15575 [Aquabacterium lacunae]
MDAVVMHWLHHRPGDFRVVRHRDGRLVGVVLMLELAEASPQARAGDPAVARLWTHVQQQREPLPGGSVWCCRLMVDAHGDALPLPTVTLSGMWLTQRTLTHPRADWNLALHHNTDAMAPLYGAMTRLNWAHRCPALDDVMDGQHHGAFVRDCVREPIGPQWRPAAPVPLPGQAPPLGRDDFTQAVREALRQCQRDEALVTNPLCHSALVQQAVESAQPHGECAVLRQLLTEGVQALGTHPADLKFHRALQATWLVPGAKQEAVAADLGLPFNTYRYHLARGAERLAQVLWPRELLARQVRGAGIEG